MKFKSEFEKKTFAKLKKLGLQPRYEGEKIAYFVNRHYLPDFMVKNSREETFYIETKGYFSPEDRQKMRLVKQQHPEKDIRLLFFLNNKLNRKSKSKYSDWAIKNGFLYAIKEIPKEWL